MIAAGTSLAAARRAMAERFRAAGLETPELDARVLIGHALGLDHASLIAGGARALGAREADALEAIAARRLDREPVARIVGRKEFWTLDLRVTAATLVPRPETETVVAAALEAIDARGPRSRALRIADLGTGTGALLLALLSELPNAIGVGTDISAAAIAAAGDNASRHGLDRRAAFVVCDFGAALGGGFDLVVSNPPYVATPEIATLEPEAASDPRIALDGGADGLAGHRAVVAEVARLLRPEGALVMELGHGQRDVVTDLARAQGLAIGPTHTDLAGIPRALCAWLPSQRHDEGSFRIGKKALGLSSGTD